jgi:hypothetical protein
MIQEECFAVMIRDAGFLGYRVRERTLRKRSSMDGRVTSVNLSLRV